MSALRRLAACALAAGLVAAAAARDARACTTTVTVCQVGGPCGYTTITSAINSLGASLVGDTCVKITDSSNYPEQVVVRNIAISGAGHLTIGAAAGATPTVAPPGVSVGALFIIADASVTISGIAILPNGTITNGVEVSSAQVTLSSVSVQDTSGKITGAGVRLDPGASWTTISSVTVSVAAPGAAAFYLSTSAGTSISYSTAQASGPPPSLGIGIYGSSAVTIASSYVQGSTAVVVSGSTGTLLSANVLAAAGGIGVAMEGGSAGLRMNQNTLTPLTAGSGVGLYLEPGSSGTIDFSTNTVQAGAVYGVFIATPAAGAAVWIASNTVLPTLTAGGGTYGLYLDGAAGAVIRNNSVYYRSGTAGTGWTYRGLYAQSSTGLSIDHNRFSFPGTLTAWNFVGLDFLGTTNSTLKFNDVSASLPGSPTSAELVNLAGGSTGTSIFDNVFASSIAVPGASSATISVDAASQAGLVSNYNDFFSSNGANTGVCAGAASTLGAAWTCGGVSQDTFSIAGNPLWASTTPGAEDFHPLSAGGRWPSFSPDGATSPTIDAGDPAEPYALESANNGYRANLGSTGGTPEASRTPAALCPIARKVCKTGACPNATLQEAVNSLQILSSPSGLPAYSCVLIEDGGPYPENVVVSNFVMSGSSAAIVADPASPARPTIKPGAGTAGVLVQVASVTLSGFDVVPVGAVSYGIWASSPSASISSVNVLDSLAKIGSAGVSLGAAQSVVAYSTVNVPSADGVDMMADGVAIRYSSVATNVGAGFGYWSIFSRAGSAGNAIDHVSVFASSGMGAVTLNAGLNAITNSAISCSGTPSNACLFVNAVNLNSVSAVNVVSAGGIALETVGGTSRFSATQSTFSTGGLASAGYAILLAGTNNALSGVYASGGAGGLDLSGGISNGVSGSTFNVTGGQAAVWFNADAGDAVVHSLISNSGGDAVLFSAGANQNTLSFSTASAGGIGSRVVYVSGASTNTITQDSLAASGSNGFGVYLQNASSNTVSYSTISASSAMYGVYFQNASTNVLTSDAVSGGAAGYAAYLDSASANNSILGSTITSSSSQYALYLPGASSNTVWGSVLSGGAFLDSGASGNTLTLSTMTSLVGTTDALFVKTATFNVVSGCYISNPSGTALQIGGTGNSGNWQNTVRQSVIVGSGTATAADIRFASTDVFTGDFIMSQGSGGALVVVYASSNAIVNSTITAGGSNALFFGAGASANSVSQSYVAESSAIASSALSLISADHNVFSGDTVYSPGAYAMVVGGFAAGTIANSVTQSVMISTGIGLVVQNASFTSVSFSTAVGSGAAGDGAWIVGSTWTTIANSYVQGSTAVFVSGSSGTLIGGSVLESVGAGGAGLDMTAGSAGLTLSSSVVQGGPLGAGVYLDSNNNGAGAVILSTNTILSGPQYGVYAQSLPFGAPLFVTSNTIVPTVSASTHTYGLYLGALFAGTSVQNNGIYYRGSGSMGTNTAYGVFAYNSSVSLDHDRINEPGAITAGGFVGVELLGSNAVFKFNDVSATGAGLATPIELQVLNSGSVVVKDNVFLDGLTNPTANYTLALSVDGPSQTGFVSDYNSFFTAAGGTAFVGGWGAIPGFHYNLANWQSATGRDAHSISGDPLFFSLAPGAEDFHPRSPAGRWSPSSQSFVTTDSSASATIDAADPAEPYANEPIPNGLRANQGSYGDTPEASKSAPPPGCSVQYTVKNGVGADFTSIGAAVAGIPKNLTVPNTCIVVVQSGTYFEEVDVNGFTTNGNRLTIMSHPNLSTAAVVNPAGTYGAFVVQNDSVTIYRIDVKPSGGSVSYGIIATSAAVVVSSVNVDGGGNITFAGLYVGSAATVSASSVTAGGGAYGIVAVGTGTSIFNSSAAASGASAAALYLNGASSASATSLYASNPLGAAVLLGNGTRSSTIAQSTMTGGAGGALVFSAAVADTVTASVVTDAAGEAANLLNSYFNTISLSTLTSSLAGAAALHVRYSSNNYVSQSLVQSAGDAVFLDTAANLNNVSLSTMTSGATASYALHLVLASSNTISGSVISNPIWTPVLFEKTSQWNTLSLSTAVPGNGYPAMNVYGSLGTSIIGSYLANAYGSATTVVQFASGSDRAFISQSTITIAAPGATALVLQVAGSTVSQSVIQSLAPAPFGAVGVSLDYHAVGDVFSGDLIQGASAFVAVGATGLVLTGDVLSATTNGSALWLSTGSAALVVASTLTAPSAFGVVVATETGDTFVGDYVQGSTAVFVTASTGTAIGGSVLFATGTAGIALELTGGSVGLSLSSSVVYGGAQGDGVSLDPFDSGLIVLSTNVFPPSAAVPIFGASLTANSALWITSNTIVPIGAPTQNTFGIELGALPSGATIQNNAIVMRQPAPSNAAVIGIYAVSSPGLQIDHNRLSDPGLVPGGAFYAAAVGYSPRATFKFNDVSIAAPAAAPMTGGYGYYTAGSPNSVLKDNVFFSSITLVSGSSATVWMDTPTLAGTLLDYNDYASSTTRNSVLVGTVSYQYPWSAVLGQDAHSISVLPYWASTAPGAENFHPLSQKGRCSDPPACTIFAADGWTAGTLDAADPAEPSALEQLPNGGRANLGSYGGTREASETPPAPAGVAIAAVYASSVGVSFTANGANAYAVVASTASNFTGIAISSASAGAQALAPQGLAANTTYFFLVKANWGDLIAGAPPGISTPTLAAAPTQSPSGTFPSVSTTSAAVAWLPNGNPLSVTTYTVVLSTSPTPPAGNAGDVSLATAPAGSPASALIGGGTPLSPNTTYYAFAAGVNWAGAASAYTLLGATATLVAAPSSAGATYVFLASTTMTVQWSSGGDPLALTTYTVTASTAPDFNAFASSITLTTAPVAGPAATLSGLSPNTTYYLRVQALAINGPPSAFASLGSTATLAAVPVLAAPAFATVLSTQIVAQWGAGGNPSGTLYDVMTATAAGFAGAATSSFTYSVSLSTAGLSPNATYFFQVAAVNVEGLASPFLALGSTWTLANAPATAASTFTNVAASSFTVAWSANGNPPATTYVVQLSTAADFNAFASSVSFSTAAPAGPSATFTGLANYTTYYFRVQAVNGLGVPTSFALLGSTTTLPPSLLPPALAGAPAIFTTSMTAAWGLSSGATGYSLVASTLSANPPTLVWASSSPFGAAATTATLTGLLPDTTYFLFVRALGPNAASFFAAYAATSTLPALPQTAASTFSGVAFTSFTAAWSGGGNPLGIATYTVVASTAPDFNAFASSVSFSTAPAGGPQATFTGLSANTTYYFGVLAVGNGGTSTPLVPLGSTTTRVADPQSLGAAGTFVAVTSSSLALAWGGNGNPLALTAYAVVASTAFDFNAGASSVTLTTAPAAGPGAALSGLLVNTTYYVGARALGAGGSSSNFVVLGATATRADLPLPAAFTGISTGAIVANWTAPTDPAGTLYQLQTALDPLFATTVTSSSTYAVSLATAGLVPNTTYYFRVLAANVDGVATPFVALGSTATLASQPSPAASTFGAVGISSLTVSWLANGNPLSVTTYTVQASTDPAFGVGASSVTLTTAPAAGPTATLGGLMFGTTYYVRVSAVNFDGISTAWTSLGSTTTLLSNLVPLIVNAQTGDNQWRAANSGLYRVSFQDGSATHLNKFAVAISTTPGQPGAFVDAVTNLSPADSFSTPWSLPASVFAAMLEGTTNYVSVRVYNNVPDTNTVVDAFYVLKDTTPPAVSGPVAGDAVVRSTGGTYYAIASTDTGGGLAAFQYSVSLTPGAGDASLVPWTNIAALNGAKTYAAPWTVNFAALASGVTNYVSVRAWDLAGTTTTVKDAFYVLKDTVGPSVAISSPVVLTGFVSATSTLAGSAASPFPLQGTEVAVLQPSANLYWNPGAGAFNSGAPVWMPAVGISSWTSSAGVQFADGVAYKVIARSSTTFSQYSTSYATASFVVDFGVPTVGVQAPAPNSTVPSLPVISGTAADPGTAASGVSAVEVRLLRLSDGLWWNWFAQSWSSLAVSTVAVGTTTWSLSPTAQLQANLASGASYYLAVRASDNALPQNQGNFFAQGSTFTYSNPTPPAAVADLAAVSGPAPGQIALSWHATGENGSSGIVLLGQYRVFYSTYAGAVPSTGAAQVAFSTSNVSPGAASGFNVTGLTAGGTYFLEIALQNTDGNWSAFSNQASTVATPAPLNAILGHVVNASTQGVTAVEVDAWNSAGALVTTAFTLADGSGTYSVGGLTAGNYKLKATWTVNGIASSVWQDGIPMGSVGVDFSLNINYSLATLTGSLATLTTASSRTGVSPSALARPSLAGSYVELAQSGRTVARVGVEPSGRWTIPSLLPGAYAVRAYTGVSFTDYQAVNLAEGETKSIGFVFDPLPDAQVYAFPNPARYSTTFRFVTPLSPVEAVVDVFDIAGRLVKEIPGSQMVPQPDGVTYHAAWDLTNSRGQAVASGVYLYLVKVKGGGNQLVKVVKKLGVVR